MKNTPLLIAIFLMNSAVYGQNITRNNAPIETERPVDKSYNRNQNIFNCDTNSLFTNHLIELSNATIADDGRVCAADFSTIGGTIETLKFWGITAELTNSWMVCNESNPLMVDISFFQDYTALQANTPLQTFNDLPATATPTVELYNTMFPIYEYDVTLSSPVPMTSGIIAINADTLGGINSNYCWFLWLQSTGGYGNKYVYNLTTWNTYADEQFAICMGGTLPNCLPPANLDVTNVGLSTATLIWQETGTATAWQIEYGEAGFIPTGSGISATDTNYTVIGLNHPSSYEFYVQANCGADSSVWSGPFQFDTKCPPVSSYPYVEGFEEGDLPICWSVNDADGDNFNWDVLEAPNSLSGGYTSHTGSYSMGSASYNLPGQQSLTPDNFLISPQLEINTGNLVLSFWVASQDLSYVAEKYAVQISTTGNTPSDFVDVVHIETLTDTLWKRISIPLSDYLGQSIYIAFRHFESTNNFIMKIDDVSIDNVSTISEEKLKTSVNIYPNPTKGNLIIVFDQVDENTNIVVCNAVGKKLIHQNIKSAETTFDLSTYDKGVYFVKVQNIDGFATYKVVRN